MSDNSAIDEGAVLKRNPLGIGITVLGAVVAVVPILVYQTQEVMPDMVMDCLPTAHAEIGVGAALAVIGVLYFLSKSKKVRFVLSILVAALALLALLFPTKITGLCESREMPCNLITFPVLTVSVILLWVLAVVGILLALHKQKFQ